MASVGGGLPDDSGGGGPALKVWSSVTICVGVAAAGSVAVLSPMITTWPAGSSLLLVCVDGGSDLGRPSVGVGVAEVPGGGKLAVPDPGIKLPWPGSAVSVLDGLCMGDSAGLVGGGSEAADVCAEVGVVTGPAVSEGIGAGFGADVSGTGGLAAGPETVLSTRGGPSAGGVFSGAPVALGSFGGLVWSPMGAFMELPGIGSGPGPPGLGAGGRTWP